MGVASGRGYQEVGVASGWNLWVWVPCQEVGVASGWNLWVWVPCIDVVSGCCCKEVYRCFPYSTCISSFLGSSIPTSLFILKMFFRSSLCYFLTIYSKRYSKNIRDRSKNRDHANILIIKLYP